ncbi:MAG: glycosylase [Acetanaerobacterium sp.]
MKIITGSLPNIPWQDRPAQLSVPVWRHTDNPVVGRNPVKGIARIFNSAVVPYGGGFAGVFRGETINGRPHLYVGTSSDGLSWDINEEKITLVDESGVSHQPLYAYDPRMVKVEDAYYVCWCGDFGGASIGMAKTTDFKTFVRLENPFLPFNRNGVLFPRKVDGKYILLSRPSDSGHTPFGDVFLSKSYDLTYWGEHRCVMQKGGDGWWQGVKIGCGPAPIETSEGWLMFYHGVTGTCNGFVYSMGAALLDLEDPSKVLYRTGSFLLTPEEWYEERGFVPNVVFPCAALCDGDTGRIAIYYGAADTYVGIAYTTLEETVAFIREHNESIGADASDGRI